jgi:polysaccharide deacetylase 2 family uncharacterized protein YibQ
MAKKSDLNQPLSRTPGEPSRRRPPFVASALISAALLLAAIAALWVAIVDHPDGGRPVAVAAIEDANPPATGSVTENETEAPAPEAATPAESAVEVTALPSVPPAVGGDPALIESSPFGPLPRSSHDGRLPREVYARRVTPVPENVPRVIIVVGGLGLSQTGTQSAIEQLPEDVTLAFAPYGMSLQRWVAKAREEGHEVILQIPLEPANYPQENPGEHTLLASAGGDYADDLHWVLARTGAYAGVMNYMGARFTADEQALVPFIGEIGERGLYYLDDGSSTESRAATVGEALRVPVIVADRIIDRDRAPQEIERELSALEAIARTRGYAVGVASAFPASVDTIARWVRAAGPRGVVVQPASAVIGN